MPKIWYKGKRPRRVKGIWFYPNKPVNVSKDIYDELVNKDDWVSKAPKPEKKE